MAEEPDLPALARRSPGTVPDAPVAAIVAHRHLRDRVTEVMRSVDPLVADATVVPACPDWTVTETLAHLVGVCIDITDGAIGDDVGTAAWADSHPARFASLGVGGLLDRWAEVGPGIDALEGLMPALIGSQFVFDATTHEHDIRGALGRPGGRGSDGVEVGLGFIQDRLDLVIRSQELPPLAWITPAWSVVLGAGDPGDDGAVELVASPFELLRAFSGRRSIEQIRSMSWSGDPDPYLGVFELGPLRPPTQALVE